ncbi:MAG: hypothetical protein J7549_08020 [Variovorax sp.]|nr:hypothetical protein [Variovorax sp.]
MPRAAFRRHGRQVLAHPGDAGRHLARLAAALELPGAEPVQGALSDLFVGCTGASADVRRSALAMAASRLDPPVRRAFEHQVDHPNPARSSVLATRWSVLASPSMDVPRRSVRCSSDDSRRLAQAGAAAVERGDLEAQEAFLGHCLECGDVLAFMLARRALARRGEPLPERWERVSALLQAGKLT